jgi:nicotinic acid mononucleotide adenylyltransferase
MCRLAAEKYHWLQISDYETRRSGKSYTVETLRALRQMQPDSRKGIS